MRKIIYLGLYVILAIILAGITNAALTYEENADAYYVNDTYYNFANIYDGNYETYGYTGTNGVPNKEILLNYTIPGGTTSAKWQRKTGTGLGGNPYQNDTIDPGCLDNGDSLLNLRILHSDASRYTFYCFDSSWLELSIVLNTQDLYEEGIWWDSTADTTAPTWDEIPPNITLGYAKDSLYVDFNATDDYLDQYFINYTTIFEINESGHLINNTLIQSSIFAINVSVNDTSGNINSTIFKVTVQDTTPPTMTIPSNTTLFEGETSLGVSFLSTDESGISGYNVNDTTNFKIDGSGYLQNNTRLAIGIYEVNVSVNDTLGNINFTIYKTSVFNTLNITIELVDPTQNEQIISNYVSFSYTPDVEAGSEIANCTVYTNITGNWQGDLINTSKLNDLETYTTGLVLISNASDYKYNVMCIDELGTETFAPENYTFTILFDLGSNFYLDDCTLTSQEALKFRLINATDSTTVNGTAEFLINYTNGGTYKTYSTLFTNNYFQEFCISPNDAVLLADIQVEYYVDPTVVFTRQIQNLTVDNVQDTIDLYITDYASLVLMTVTDNANNKIEDVLIKVQKWDIDTNSFLETAAIETNFDGEALTYINLYNTWYKFILIYENRVVLETDPSKISSQTLDFVIATDTFIYDEGLTPLGIYATLSFDNNTQYFEFTWDELEENVDSATLVIEKITPSGAIIENSTTVNGGSGTIYLGINNVSSDRYVAKAYVTDTNVRSNARTLEVNFDYDWQTFGDMGPFLSILMVVTLAMVGLWNITIAIVLTLVGLVAVSMLEFFNLSLVMINTLIVLGIIAIIRINRRV